MFALAGSLMVASLRRAPAVDVIGHRLRRLVPPLWLLGAIVIPVMLWHGWRPGTADTDLHPVQLALWLFPILDPPASAWGADATVVLWYIRTYLWFVLLTPILLPAFRRWPLIAMTIPIALIALDAALDSPMHGTGPLGAALVDVGTIAACWMLGSAHRDGLLRRLRVWAVIAIATPLIALGAAWVAVAGTPDSGYDLNETPLAQALVSIGVVLLLLRVEPRLVWLDRVPVLGRLVTVLSARAITIYLWHNVAIAVAQPIDDGLRWSSQFALLGTAVVLTAGAVFAFGWLEDIAARRPIRLIPGERHSRA